MLTVINYPRIFDETRNFLVFTCALTWLPRERWVARIPKWSEIELWSSVNDGNNLLRAFSEVSFCSVEWWKLWIFRYSWIQSLRLRIFHVVISRAFVDVIVRARFIIINSSSLITAPYLYFIKYKETHGKSIIRKKEIGFKKLSMKFYLFAKIMNVYIIIIFSAVYPEY